MPLDQRREQLLDAALAVVLREGYGGISVAAIAREAGVTRPVIYGAFDDLADLLRTLLERTRARAVELLAEAVAPALGEVHDVDRFVDTTVRRLVRMVRDDPGTWRAILVAPPGTPVEVWRAIEQGRAEVHALLVQVLARTEDGPEGGPKGGLEVGLDPDLAAHALVAAAERLGRLVLEEPERVDLDALVRSVQVVVRALDRERGTAAPGGRASGGQPS